MLKRFKTKETGMTKTLTRTALIIALAALSACATVQGMGEDLSSAGTSLSKSAS